MATRTDNLKLSKAETSDGIKSTLTANNQNFDKLDGVITRLKNNQLRGTASGTEIEIGDAGEVESVLQLSGNSEQDSRSGKNLFDENNAPNATIIGNDLVYANDGTTIISGVFKENTDYTLQAILKKETSDSNVGLRIYYTDGTYEDALQRYLTTEYTYEYHIMFSVPKAISHITTYGGQNLHIRRGTLQIAEGIGTSDYEPYGLQPSPDFPSEIRSVKGKSDNLFDISTKTDNTSFTWAGGEDYGTTGAVRSDYIPIGDIKALSSNYRFNITFHNANKGYLGNGPELTTSSQGAFYSMAIPDNSNIAYFRVTYRPSPSVSGNPTDMTILTDIMLNKGTEALPYQPYGYVPVEVKVEGKNLASETEHAFISSAGVVTLAEGNIMSGFIEVENGASYILSGYYPEFVRMQRPWQIAFYDSNYNFISRQLGIAYNVAFTISGENIKYIRAWTDRGSISDPIPAYLQVEKGTIATPYEPYKAKTISLPLGDIELRSTPDETRDAFERVDGVWNKKNNVTTFQLPTSLSVGSALNSYGYIQYSANILSENSKAVRVMSNRFGSNDAFVQDSKVTQEMIYSRAPDYPNYLYICIKAERLDGETYDLTTSGGRTSAIRTWLANNPTEVIYPLANPTYTPITDQALISALDELEELILHKGYNYITATAVNGVKAHLDLSYYKDINIVLDNINASILSLGGDINV